MSKLPIGNDMRIFMKTDTLHPFIVKSVDYITLGTAAVFTFFIDILLLILHPLLT